MSSIFDGCQTLAHGSMDQHGIILHLDHIYDMAADLQTLTPANSLLARISLGPECFVLVGSELGGQSV